MALSHTQARVPCRCRTAAKQAAPATGRNSLPAANINRAVNLPLLTAPAIALPPATECAGSLVDAGKLMKDAQLIAVSHPITRHLGGTSTVRVTGWKLAITGWNGQ